MVRGRLRRLAIVALASSRRLATIVALASLLAVAAPSLTPPIAHADARTDYLVRLLRTSDAFRVRAQAALSLASVTPEPQVIEALGAALRDDSAAVRAAAAQSLERLGDPSAIPALRGAQRDRESAVRDAATRAVRALERVASAGGGGSRGGSVGGGGTEPPRAGARFYVGVGMPGTTVRGIDRATLESARRFLAGRVQQLDGVRVAPESESPREASAVIRRESLTGFYLDCSIVSVETRPDGGVRAAVSVVVQTYPDRNVRSMLSGAATVMGETGPAAQRAAIEAALSGALRNLGTAMAAGSPR